jgi:hypothetical protein
LTALIVTNDNVGQDSVNILHLEAFIQVRVEIVGRIVGWPWDKVVLSIVDQSVELISADLLIAVVIIDWEKLIWSVIVALTSDVWVREAVGLAHRSVAGEGLS